eukprot:6030297-Prymnesium_polylepis.1
MSVSCRFHDDRFRGDAALKFQVNPDFMKSRRYTLGPGPHILHSAICNERRELPDRPRLAAIAADGKTGR